MRISVAMCVYNGGSYIAEQLESIAAQTRLPDELIVCDDCSRDATVDIVRDFAARAPFPVRLYVNETNLRVIKNFEKAISLCTGDIIALSDQDDVWHCDKLEIFEEVLNAKPYAGLIFCDANLVDENLVETGYSNWETSELDLQTQKLIKTKAAFNYLLRKPLVWGCMMAFRAKYKDLVLPIPDHISDVHHDYWISLLVSAVSYLEPIPECLVEYRQHSGQQLGQRVIAKDERLSATANFIKIARNNNHYDDFIDKIAAVRERLEFKAEHFRVQDSAQFADSRLRHLVNRKKILGNDAGKTFLIAKELFTLRYHRHSSGLKSAIKDFFLS